MLWPKFKKIPGHIILTGMGDTVYMYVLLEFFRLCLQQDKKIILYVKECIQVTFCTFTPGAV